jgi:hypothetical protein
MKCCKCNTDKDPEEFVWRNQSRNQRRTICKDCNRPYQKSKYQDRKQATGKGRKQSGVLDPVAYRRARLDSILKLITNHLREHPCVQCGESDVLFLDFHHRDPKDKRCTVSQMRSNRFGLKTVMEEIAKCDVLCVKCHRLVTAVQGRWGLIEYLIGLGEWHHEIPEYLLARP